MCPACIASAALIAGSVGSTGALTAFFVKKFRTTNVANRTPEQTQSKEKYNGNQQSGNPASESCIAGRVG
jgi:hypothetical protein